MLEYYLKRWQLSINGETINTPSSQIVPVIQTNGDEAILKLASCEEEKVGHLVMCWWEGEGAAKVLAHHDTALLMEKARDQQSLLTMALNNQADQATAIMCNAIKQLHTPRLKQPPTELISLQQHFLSLAKIAQTSPNIFAQQLNNIIDLSGIERTRIIKWIIAFAGLSAAWFIEDNQIPEAKFVMSIAKLAMQQLNPELIKNLDDF